MSLVIQSRMLPLLLQLGPPAFRASAVAEQSFEHDTRVSLGRQRRRRRRPGQVVLIRARVAVVAVADLSDQIGADLERRNRRDSLPMLCAAI